MYGERVVIFQRLRLCRSKSVDTAQLPGVGLQLTSDDDVFAYLSAIYSAFIGIHIWGKDDVIGSDMINVGIWREIKNLATVNMLSCWVSPLSNS